VKEFLKKDSIVKRCLPTTILKLGSQGSVPPPGVFKFGHIFWYVSGRT